ncbi:hypothetical protein O3M35_006510 [Rhynocoris fuscipes]|uniref:Uncharacterized protein n=1 Tax=Rhynocoris fuscipes TaxID=488301 RepID=A0AAW1DEK2_9HEMI
MEDYYSILGCDRTASYEQLKEAYISLAKKFHPDKCKNTTNDTNEDFKKIDRAWKTLREPLLKKNYDEDLKQSELNDEILVYGNFKLKQLSYDPQGHIYFYSCRCGGQYYFTKNESDQFDSYLVSCDTCSLMISVDLQS